MMNAGPGGANVKRANLGKTPVRPVNVLFALRDQDELLQRIIALDEGLAVRTATPPLFRFLRGELREDTPERRQAEADAAEMLPDCEVMIGYSRLPDDVITYTPNLRWIMTLGAGIDRLSPGLAARVLLTNGAGIGAEPIAEQVLMYLFMLARGEHVYFRRQMARHWEKGVPVREIAGMTMGIVGFGAIGAAVARRARGLGMRVIALRRSATGRAADALADEVCPPSDLAYLLGSSDVVVLAVPLTAETRGLIGREELAGMRSGAYLINVARGPVVDEAALVAALRSGRLAGAGIDVFDDEPLPPDSPFWDLPNVIVTPHSASAAEHRAPRLADLVCDNLRRYLDGQPLRNVVDVERGY
jgi:phosphoglycerate dehydrogenase-like enzyme